MHAANQVQTRFGETDECCSQVACRRAVGAVGCTVQKLVCTLGAVGSIHQPHVRSALGVGLGAGHHDLADKDAEVPSGS